MTTKIKKQKSSVALVKNTNQTISPENLISQAISQNVPVETMEKLLAMRTQLKAERAKEEFISSMAKFQSECPVIEKKKKIYEKGQENLPEPQRKVRYKYAPLDSIIEQTKDYISSNGFSYSFDEEKDEKNTKIICKVTHIMGHAEQTAFQIPIGTEQYMSDVQKHGARMTFGKRYAFCNAFGILTGDEDTDGQVDGTGENNESKEAPKSSKFTEMLGKLEKVKVDQLDLFLEKIKASSSYTDEQKNEFTLKVLEIKNRK
jgi:hypothetical protein